MDEKFTKAYDYTLYPNQAIFANNREPDFSKGINVWNRKRFLKALKELSYTSFTLWCIGSMYAPYKTAPFSANYLQSEFGFSRNACSKAMKELVEKGYVEKIEINGIKCYLFIASDI